jgi:hypothetical protein
VGEILDGAFTAIRRYPRTTLGLAAAVMLVVTAVDVLTQWWLVSGIEPPTANATLSQAQDYLSRVGTASTIGFVVGVGATLLLTGLITAVIGEGVLGRPVTPADAWLRLRPLFWRLAGATLLTFLMVAGVIVAALIPGLVLVAAGAGAPAAVLLVVGGIAGAVAACWLYVALSFAPAAVVLERQSVRGALRRSRLLVRGSWWRVFGILLLAALIAAVVSAIVGVPFGLAGGGLATLGNDTAGPTFSQLVISGIGSLLAGTLVRPFSAGVAALLYIDRRMRVEALDVALSSAASETPRA